MTNEEFLLNLAERVEYLEISFKSFLADYNQRLNLEQSISSLNTQLRQSLEKEQTSLTNHLSVSLQNNEGISSNLINKNNSYLKQGVNNSHEKSNSLKNSSHEGESFSDKFSEKSPVGSLSKDLPLSPIAFNWENSKIETSDDEVSIISGSSKENDKKNEKSLTNSGWLKPSSSSSANNSISSQNKSQKSVNSNSSNSSTSKENIGSISKINKSQPHQNSNLPNDNVANGPPKKLSQTSESVRSMQISKNISLAPAQQTFKLPRSKNISNCSKESKLRQATLIDMSLSKSYNSNQSKIDISQLPSYSGGNWTTSKLAEKDENLSKNQNSETKNEEHSFWGVGTSGKKRKSEESLSSVTGDELVRKNHKNVCDEEGEGEWEDETIFSDYKEGDGTDLNAAILAESIMLSDDDEMMRGVHFGDGEEGDDEDAVGEFPPTPPPPPKKNQREFRSTMDLLKDFDKIPNPKDDEPGVNFIYKEKGVRKKVERKQLPGWSCPECEEYYNAIGEENAEKIRKSCSRHRFNQQVPTFLNNTPKNFWDTDFPSTAESIEQRVLVQGNKSQFSKK